VFGVHGLVQDGYVEEPLNKLPASNQGVGGKVNENGPAKHRGVKLAVAIITGKREHTGKSCASRSR